MDLPQYWIDHAQRLISQPPFLQFQRIVCSETRTDTGADSAIVMDANGGILYPYPIQNPDDSIAFMDRKNDFPSAWRAEYVLNDPMEAARLYQRRLTHPDPEIQLNALAGAMRCLIKAGQIPQALDLLSLRLPYQSWPGSESQQSLLLSIHLKWLHLLKTYQPERLPSVAETILKKLTDDQTIDAVLPSSTRVFALEGILDLLNDPNLSLPVTLDLARAKRLLKAERLALALVDQVGQTWIPNTLSEGRLVTFGAHQPYGYLINIDHRNVILLIQPDTLERSIALLANRHLAASLQWRLSDASGSVVCGQTSQTDPLIVKILSGPLMGWKMELFLPYQQVFDIAAHRQVMLTVWSAVLVILILICASMAAGASINRQIRLNRLKNNFIATITHELKTPLASMRLLVDTLLEGRYRDQRQVHEYLELISKENVRLTGLIDNFLTFSRMERRKQAFHITPIDPVVAVRDASDALRSKFAHGNCRFEQDLAEDLPNVLADHDALVTVLVNLLDNAYKYSAEDKHIVLKVRSADRQVCFSVTDNGYGIPRHLQKRIFHKFYQVDRSLARRTEGSGLGLSIVQFIVQAHNGSIQVKSRAGQGSTFLIRLPGSPSD